MPNNYLVEKSYRFKSKTFIALLIIVAIAALLRLLFLGTIPNGFFCDEASNGYDSYSILKTLRDQHGNFLPLFARALDDYRPSLYIYLTAPFIQIFGLNEFAVRLPAAIFGVLTIIVFYALVKELFDKRVALITALLLAMNPWHIHFSRIAFEATLIPFFTCLSVWLFLKSLKHPNYLPLTAIVWGLSLHTYQASRVFFSLFFLGIILIYRKELWQLKKQVLIAISLFLLIFIPLFSFWISPEGLARAKGTGIETNIVTILKYYLSYFNPDFLFFNGDPISRHSAAKIGELYYFELITVPVGIFYVLKEKPVQRLLLLLWLFLYPIPAALTAPEHALRAIAGVPIFTLFSAYGVSKLIDLLRLKQKAILTVSLVIVISSLAILSKRYFVDYPLYATKDWQYGIREAIAYAEQSSYPCVILSNQIYLKKCGSLHVFLPFYTQYPPQEYQRSPISPVTRKQLFLGEGSYTVGKYKITSIENRQVLNSTCLFIVDPKELDAILAQGYHVKEVHAVKDSRGVEYLKLIEVRS